VLDGTDCDDTDRAVHPGAVEVCDDADTDEDCDTLADDADPGVDPATRRSWYPDADADTYGALDAVAACDPPAGAVPTGTDCDDTDPAVHPGAAETCDNGLDDDCDPATDDACSDNGDTPGVDDTGGPGKDGCGCGVGMGTGAGGPGPVGAIGGLVAAILGRRRRREGCPPRR
jgi:MYXO-CTERM domain-containing protein